MVVLNLLIPMEDSTNESEPTFPDWRTVALFLPVSAATSLAGCAAHAIFVADIHAKIAPSSRVVKIQLKCRTKEVRVGKGDSLDVHQQLLGFS